jgi:rare lipoprotein A
MTMSIRLLAPLAAALLLATSSLSHAQSAASAPAGTAPAAATAAPSAEAGDGKVAYYGRKFAGRKTASGERFNPNAMTMAHKTLPMGTMVRVTNAKNSKSAVVRVNDRGPTTPDRVGDLSFAAAKKVGMLRSGVIDAKLETVGTGRAGKMRRTTRKA